ncbi:MIP family Ig-specific serine endopeptidase [Mycoplasma buteonis]|uniref:MIP family Ig-specific serine endopeptidase n=1 Tax=Mycoplasma buteonis TaxID=171280 RepID=UPI0006909D56|nr:DUF31 family protein [Mycoplasma buteonis]
MQKKFKKILKTATLTAALAPSLLLSACYNVSEKNISKNSGVKDNKAVEVEALKNEIADIRNDIANLINEYVEIFNSVEPTEEKIQNIKVTIPQKEKEIKNLKQTVERNTSKIKDEFEKLESNNNLNDENRKLIDQLSQYEVLTDEQLNSFNDSIKKQITDLNNLIKSIIEDTKKLKDTQNEVISLNNSLAFLSNQFLESESKLNIWKLRIQKLQEVIFDKIDLIETYGEVSQISKADIREAVNPIWVPFPRANTPDSSEPDNSQGSAGSTQGSAGSTQGSAGSTQGSAGSTQGSAGSTQGSAGSTQGSAGSTQGSINKDNNNNPNLNNNPGSSNKPNQEPPKFPDFPGFPTWNFGSQSNSDNSYPDYVSEFQKANAEDIYREIYDRTFSFKYSIQEKGGFKVSDISQGTAWILDFHKYTNSANKYKIFMATNMHVLDHFSNTLSDQLNKQLNYEDPTGAKVVDFSLGKTQNVPSFNSIPNNSYASHISEKGGDIQYYNSTQHSALSSPKIVFAGVDFLNKDIYTGKTQWLEKKQQYIDEMQPKPGVQYADDDSERMRLSKEYAQKIDYVPFYVDFGIFEFDVDLDQISDNKLKEWLKKGIEATSNYIKRINSTKVPNHITGDSSLPFLTVDYLAKSKNAIPSKYSSYSDKALSNAQNVYIAGYPRNNGSKTYWMQNNPTERESKETSYFRSPKNSEAFAYATNDVESKVATGNVDLYKEVWNRPLLSFYGYNYNIKFSSLYYGASGSVVYNDFGEIIGIYNGVSAAVNFGDLMKNGTFAPLVQLGDIQEYGNTVYAYNLLDGSDKTIFKNQKNSYRENLKTIYQTGFSDNSKTTALFPKGY